MFIILAFMGRIDAKLVEYVVISVISFYFAKSTALDVPVQAVIPDVEPVEQAVVSPVENPEGL